MTAEVIVMNTEAVALAADSAVTLGDKQKVLNTANKIFMLAPGYSIGILVYNSATIMGIPWEIIIKLYRDYISKEQVTFQNLEEYANDFIRFIELKGKDLFTEDQEFGYFLEFVQTVYDNIVLDCWGKIKNIFYSKAEISSVEIENVLKESIEFRHNFWKTPKDMFEKEKCKDFRDCVKKKFGDKLDELIKYMFGRFSLSPTERSKLLDIAINIFSKRKIINYSGIVFVGYGKENLYPRYSEIIINCYLCNKLLFLQGDFVKIGYSDSEVSASISPFAQREIVELLLKGRHPDYRRCLKKNLQDSLSESTIDEIFVKVEDEFSSYHTKPIINTIRFLPKDELASVARTLVSLTSFMKRVSLDLETVGGPVDVAVISKKDGFIWIERKHYFDSKRNLHFGY